MFYQNGFLDELANIRRRELCYALIHPSHEQANALIDPDSPRPARKNVIPWLRNTFIREVNRVTRLQRGASK
jgi:hypothetical protein